MEMKCRAVFLVGFCWFLLFAVSTNMQGRFVVPCSASFGGSKSRGASRQDGSVLNYVSKRRVPNGPDPIHNRTHVTGMFQGEQEIQDNLLIERKGNIDYQSSRIRFKEW